jgi:hypothetical protein
MSVDAGRASRKSFEDTCGTGSGIRLKSPERLLGNHRTPSRAARSPSSGSALSPVPAATRPTASWCLGGRSILLRDEDHEADELVGAHQFARGLVRLGTRVHQISIHGFRPPARPPVQASPEPGRPGLLARAHSECLARASRVASEPPSPFPGVVLAAYFPSPYRLRTGPATLLPLEGLNGSTPERAVIVHSVPEEDDWLAAHFPGWMFLAQTLA